MRLRLGLGGWVRVMMPMYNIIHSRQLPHGSARDENVYYAEKVYYPRALPLRPLVVVYYIIH